MNDPKELKKAIDDAVQKNTKLELGATLKQLEELKKLTNNKEDRASIDAKIKILKDHLKKIGHANENDDSR